MTKQPTNCYQNQIQMLNPDPFFPQTYFKPVKTAQTENQTVCVHVGPDHS